MMDLYDLGVTVWLICCAVCGIGLAAGVFQLGQWLATRQERDQDIEGQLPTRRW